MRRRGFDLWTGVSPGLSVAYLLVIVWPLAPVPRASVTDGGRLTGAHFRAFFSSKLYYQSPQPHRRWSCWSR